MSVAAERVRRFGAHRIRKSLWASLFEARAHSCFRLRVDHSHSRSLAPRAGRCHTTLVQWPFDVRVTTLVLGHGAASAATVQIYINSTMAERRDALVRKVEEHE